MKVALDEEGLLTEPCIDCDKVYFEDIWYEPQCDEKECLYKEQKLNRCGKLFEDKMYSKKPSWRWKCERCGKLIPYMADFCHECADELLGEAPKPFIPLTESEEQGTNINNYVSK